MRQDFVANVSHELKTPLAVIKSSVETLVDGAAEEPEARGEFLAQITRESDRLEALIQDLLSLARIESGHLGLEPQAIAPRQRDHRLRRAAPAAGRGEDADNGGETADRRAGERYRLGRPGRAAGR